MDKNIEIVIMTAYTDKPLSEIISDMELLSKLLYIAKPFVRREEIQQMTISLIEKWNMEKELAEKSQQIAINKQRLEAVLDSTQDAIAMFDVSGRLLFANRWYGNTFGLNGPAILSPVVAGTSKVCSATASPSTVFGVWTVTVQSPAPDFLSWMKVRPVFRTWYVLPVLKLPV